MESGTTLRFDFPSGYATTRGTVELLAEAVRTYSVHPDIRARAREITAHLQSMDTAGEIEAVWDFILGNVRYLKDPLFAEYITAPDQLDAMVDQGTAQEDCEGIALYAATLLCAMGIESQFVIMGRNPTKPRKFSHCYLRVKNPRTRQWLTFDPIGYWEAQAGTFGPDAVFDLGDSLHEPGQPIEYWQLDGTRDSDMLGGLFDDCGLGDNASNLATVEQYGNPVADGAMQYGGPYGAIIGGLFKLGTGIADARLGKPVTPSTQASKPGSKGPLKFAGPRITPQQAAAAKVEMDQMAQDEKTNPWLVGAAALLGLKLFGVL